jgi:NAD(P)-dependent dehydrogenase (short-subunit alcohol dehydrogenase family)
VSLAGLQDRVVIVTGGASGIGRATAARLVQEGARVALVDLDGDAAQAAARELGDAVLPLTGDVSSESDVDRYFGEAIERFGRIDSLHNNAGIEGPVAPLVDFDIDSFQTLLRINQLGIFLNLRQMLRTARAARSPATIVNMASAAGQHGVPGLGVYGSTKAAIIGLTRAAAVESAAAGIRVNAIAPGPVDTPLFGRFEEDFRNTAESFLPAGRLGRAEEVAAVAAFLLSDEAPFITGAVYNIDGGETA